MPILISSLLHFCSRPPCIGKVALVGAGQSMHQAAAFQAFHAAADICRHLLGSAVQWALQMVTFHEKTVKIMPETVIVKKLGQLQDRQEQLETVLQPDLQCCCWAALQPANGSTILLCCRCRLGLD